MLQSIHDRSEAATKFLAEAPVPDPVSEQPQQILATMREYQLQVRVGKGGQRSSGSVYHMA